ncbi:hypothetical protein [Flavobacterium sp. ZS1P14]|uniref:hypothetical protein n=1 Tax=Flavobacterium sp. ZS1P14 TaxID=3401729 RepID=UPI003AACFF59
MKPFKTILTVLLTLTLFSSYGQQQKDTYLSFTSGFDVKNETIGSPPTNNEPALNYQFQFGMVGNNVEVNIGYEVFPRLDFDKYTVGVGYHFHLYGNALRLPIHTVFIPSIEPTLIGRHGTWGGGLSYNQVSSHLSLGLNLTFRWHLSDTTAFEYSFNALPRTDLSAMYGDISTRDHASIAGVGIVGNNFLKLTYMLPIGQNIKTY